MATKKTRMKVTMLVVGGGEEGFLSDSFPEESEEEEEDSDADAEEATPAPPAIDEAVDSTSQSKDPEARPKDLVKSPTKPLSAFGFKKPSEGTEKSTSVSGAEVTEGNVFWYWRLQCETGRPSF